MATFNPYSHVCHACGGMGRISDLVVDRQAIQIVESMYLLPKDKIRAIKVIRNFSTFRGQKLGLRQAKEYVEERWPESFGRD